MAQGERLYKTAAANTGLTVPPSAVFTFQNVPQGLVYTGTIQILEATPWSFHQATVGGILWAEWNGFQPSPVIQAIGGEVVEITSTALINLTPYQAVYIGRIDPEDNYVAAWPESSNTAINGTQADQTFSVPNAVSNFTASIAVGVPGQVLAIQFNGIGGTATGLRLSATAFPGTVYRTTYPYPANNNNIGPWWFVPVMDPVVNIRVEAILNSVLGGNFFGQLNIAVLPGPLYTPVLQNGFDITVAPQGVIGRQVEATIAPGTANTVIIPEAPTGYIYHIKNVEVIYIAAPASAQTLVLRGTFNAPNGLVYWRDMCPVAVARSGGSGPADFYVGSAARADPAEGLVATNNASQNAIYVINYDLEPFPQGVGLY